MRPETLKSKGCDASNDFDEEVPDSEQECSDDERVVAEGPARPAAAGY